jgi:nitrogen regulatory protein PII
MYQELSGKDLVLLCVVVSQGMGSKIVQTAKKDGVSGGTVLHGKGVAHSFVAQLVGGIPTRKEVILMAGEEAVVTKSLNHLREKFDLDAPGTGIAFTLDLCGIAGTRSCSCEGIDEKKGTKKTMYQLIMSIVDKGKASDVVEAAIAGGATGGTVINGRGSGIHETQKVFSMYIEPEKEVIMIVTKTETTEKMVHSIRTQLRMEEPGNGIIFILPVTEVYGIYQED